MNKISRTIVFLLAGVLLAGAAIFLVVRGRGPSLPAPGSAPYEEMTRAFYWGLSALEVGLLDDARQQFTKATTIVPQEPAAWANLGLTQLRLGELDAAAAPVDRALALAPDNGDLVLLAARMEAARGRLDEAVMGLPHWVNANAATWLDYDRDGRLDLFLAGYWPDDVDLRKLETTKIMLLRI